MKEPEEILKSWSIETNPRLVGAIAEAQREAWNEALDVAAENAEAIDGYNTGFSGSAASVDKQSILKLKK